MVEVEVDQRFEDVIGGAEVEVSADPGRNNDAGSAGCFGRSRPVRRILESETPGGVDAQLTGGVEVDGRVRLAGDAFTCAGQDGETVA